MDLYWSPQETPVHHCALHPLHWQPPRFGDRSILVLAWGEAGASPRSSAAVGYFRLATNLRMTLRSIVRDFRESFGNLPRRKNSSIQGLLGHHREKSLESSDQLQDSLEVTQQSSWASLPPELLRGVLKRLKQDKDNNWPSRKDVVACASVCTTWRDMCKGIVRNPEFCGKFMLPVSLKQPGSRDGLTQCFIKRDKSKLTYHLYLSLTPGSFKVEKWQANSSFKDMIDDNGKFLLSAKRSRRMIYTDHAISMDSKNICRSSSGYIGRLRSNFFRTKYIMYDTQPRYNARTLCLQERNSRGFFSRKVFPKVKTGSYPIAQVKYEKNVLGLRGPRQMQCTMHSIPTSVVDPDGIVPGQPKELLSLGYSRSPSAQPQVPSPLHIIPQTLEVVTSLSLVCKTAMLGTRRCPWFLGTKHQGGTRSCRAGASTSMGASRWPRSKTSSW